MIVENITSVPHDCKCTWSHKVIGPPPNKWWRLTKYIKGCPYHKREDEEK